MKSVEKIMWFRPWILLLLLLGGAARPSVQAQNVPGCDPLGRTPLVDFQLTYDVAANRYTAWYVPTDNSLHRAVTGQFTIITPNGFTTPGSDGRDASFQITNINGTWADFVIDNEQIANARLAALPALSGVAVHQVGMAPAGVDIDPDGAGPQTTATPVTAGVAVPLFSFPGTGCASVVRILVNGEPIQSTILANFGANVNNEITLQIPRAAGQPALERYCKNATLNTVTLVLPDIQDDTQTLCATSATYSNNYFTQVLRNWNPANLPAGTSVVSAANQQWGSFTVSPASLQGNVSLNASTGAYTLTYPTVGGVIQPGSLTICNTLGDNCNTGSDGACVVISWSGSGSVSIAASGPNCISGGAASLTLSATSGFSSYSWVGSGLTASSGNPVTATLSSAGVYAYTVIATNGQSCSATSTTSFTIGAGTTVASIVPSNPTSCSGVDGQLTLTGLVANQSYLTTYTKNGANLLTQTLTATGSGQLVISGLSAGIYSFTVSNGGCSSSPVSATLVDPGALPLPTISVASSKTICIGNTVQLTASGVPNAVFNWTGPNLSQATGSSVTATPTNVGVVGYTLTQTVGNCTSPAASVALTVEQKPVVTLASPVCNGNTYTVSFTATAGTVSANAGTVAGNLISGIPVGTNLVVTATNGTCVGQGQVTSPACTDPCTNVAINLGTPVCGAVSGTYEVSYTLPVGATVKVNTGTVSSGLISGIPSGTPLSLTVSLAGCPDKVFTLPGITCPPNPQPVLDLTKQVSKTNAQIGEVVKYTITITNKGTVPATNVDVQEAMSGGLTLVPGSISTTTGTYSAENPVSIWKIPSLSAGAVATLSFSASITQTGVVYNTAVVPGDTATVCTTVPIKVCKGSPVNVVLSAPTGYTTYQWYRNGVAISLATSRTYTASQLGEFTVKVNQGQCPNGVCCPMVIQEEESISFALVPTTPTCNGNQPLANGSLTINGLGSAPTSFSYAITQGNSFTTTNPVLLIVPENGLIANNLVGGMTYTVRIKNAGGCWQDQTVSVNSANCSCTVPPPTVVCAITEICKGGTTTMSAKGCEGGTIKWSDGKTGATIMATPSVTTTYTASCVIGSCTSGSSNTITVTVLDPKMPTIVASSDNVCPGASVTLTASGCSGGTIEWSDGAQTGASIVVTPYGKTTYTAQCRIGNCLSLPAEKIINMATDMPAPTIVSSATAVCPGGSVTLTVNNCVGTPIWTSTTATTSSIVVTPTQGNNSYSVSCKNGACVSKSSPVYSINIVAPVIPTITASTDSICAKGAVTLTAADCNGTVVWSVEGKTGTSITVNPTATTSYSARCQYQACLSAASNTVTVTVVTPTAPIISASKTLICSGEKITLTARGCDGTVQWYGIDRIGASIDIYPTATTEYSASCKQGSCESDVSNKVRITVNTSAGAPPVVTASTLTTCSGGPVSLTATGCEGSTVKWSDGQEGSVVSVTPTPTNNSFYALCQPGTQCGTVQSNVLTITVTATPTPTIVRCLCSTDTICPGEQVKFSVKNCQGTPHWSTGETTTSIVVSPTVTTGYTVYCQDGICKSVATEAYTITVIPVAAPTITASATVVAPGGTVTLTATGCTGTVIWSSNDINGNNKGASIVVRPEGKQTYYAQCQFRSCLSNTSTTVIINPGDCSAMAGTLVAVNPTVCGGSSTTVSVGATLNGGLVQPAGYSVLYILANGGTGVVQQTSPTAQFTVSSTAAAYTIHTLVYNANPTDVNFLDVAAVKNGISTVADIRQLMGSKCADLSVAGANVNVNVVSAPSLSASGSLTVCPGGTVSLTATGCAGGTVTWSDGTLGASYTKPVSTDQNLTATCTLDGCVSAPSSLISLKIGAPAIPAIAVDKPAICTSETISLTATGCSTGTYVWSDPTSTTGNVLTVTPTTTTAYRVKCVINQCTSDWSASNTITVGVPSAPTIAIGGTTAAGSTSVCFGTPVTLVATGCSPTSNVIWSNNQTGNSIVVTPTGSATFTAQCSNSTTCKSVVSNPIAITVIPQVPQPTVVDKTNTCPSLTVDLATAVASSPATMGGVFAYYTDASLSTATKVANPAAVGTGSYYVVEKTTSGCLSLPTTIHVQISTCNNPTPCDGQNPATANAGVDASVCATTRYQLSGTMGGAGKLAHWTTSGSGSFNNSYALNAIYTASVADILSGTVTLTLSVSATNADCPVAVDQMVLTLTGSKSIPTITVVGGTKLCFGDSVTLKAPAGAASYLWNTKATTQSIVVKTSGVYTVQVLDSKGCASVASDSVVVHVADPIQPPLVTNLRNTCPSKIVDLTKALSVTTVGSSYVYRICECNTSNIVIRPDSVCEGTYWVIEKDASGCSSKPSKVIVKVFDCAADTLNADVSITQTADKTIVKHGETITYTITVSNSGPHTAHNIDIRNVLPMGLTPSGAPTSTYTLANGVITKHIDSLKVGQSVSIVYVASLSLKGEVINKAEITYLDNKDTNLANNTASVTVRDTSSSAALPVGLLGVAKSVGTPTLVEKGVYDIPYTIKLSNMGLVALSNVQVVDNLSKTFGHGALIVSNLVPITVDAGLTANPQYTGQGSITNLLVDSLSTLPVGAKRDLSFTVRVNVKNADSLTFYNTAFATALTPNKVVVADTSTSGTDPDPQKTLDPRASNVPTPISLNNISDVSHIGVAMAVADTVRQTDGTVDVTYQVVIQNFGTATLKGVEVRDSLVNVFNTASGSKYFVVKAPITTSSGSALKLNSQFDGYTDPRLVIGDSTSSLAAGKTDTLQFVINVGSNGSTTLFLNSVLAEASAPSGRVSDVSTNGLVADLNGNGDPTDDNEREATPLALPPSFEAIFIPEGFSPNGDGVNDVFVIQGMTNLTVSLEVYNRWGSLVYQNEDYRNDWDSKPNRGLAVGSDANGLPDGTYYYMVRTSDGRKFVRYMTINR
ncbi:hypothetical protein GCM10028819_00020 [Spirosoma humi]